MLYWNADNLLVIRILFCYQDVMKFIYKGEFTCLTVKITRHTLSRHPQGL